jgi:hypothetical protein
LADEGGYIFEWMLEAHRDTTSMLLRRELDGQSRAESLHNLLRDIIDHPTVINRERYRAHWGPSQPAHRSVADRAFDRFPLVRIAGQPEADHIDPAAIRGDLDRLRADVEHYHAYAQSARAHRSPEPPRALNTAALNIEGLHKALATTRGVIRKYYALLTQSVIDRWEAVAQFNTIEAFTRAWVEDPDAVKRAIGKEPRP